VEKSLQSIEKNGRPVRTRTAVYAAKLEAQENIALAIKSTAAAD